MMRRCEARLCLMPARGSKNQNPATSLICHLCLRQQLPRPTDRCGGGGSGQDGQTAPCWEKSNVRQPGDRVQLNFGKISIASKPSLRPAIGENKAKLPPICFMTLSTIARPRPPPPPIDEARTNGFLRVFRVSAGIILEPLSSRIRSYSTIISIGSS